jgi:hypothetical protein
MFATIQVKAFFSSRLLSTNTKIKIHITVMLPEVLYGCETWSLRLREGSRLRVFKNRVLKRIFRPKSDEIIEGWRNLRNEDLYSTSRQIQSNDQVKEDEIGRARSKHERGVHTGFWYENLKERGRWEDINVDGRILLKWILDKYDGGMDWINLAQDRDQ